MKLEGGKSTIKQQPSQTKNQETLGSSPEKP
jgi:hypothetical protein